LTKAGSRFEELIRELEIKLREFKIVVDSGSSDFSR